MEAVQRIRLIRIIEKMEKNPEFCNKFGIKNTSEYIADFADYFFDGFVVDWVVQDRINNAKRQVEEAIRRTESIVNQLQRM